MRIAGFVKFYLIVISLLFVVFSMYNIEFKREVLLFLAVSLVSPYAFKETIKIRGVKKGDFVLISFKSNHPTFGIFMQKTLAKALSNGKLGEIIEVEFDLKKAKGEILSYGGLLFPPEVNLLYYEEESTIRREIK